MAKFLRPVLGVRALLIGLVIVAAVGAVPPTAYGAKSGRFRVLPLVRNDFNRCALGFHFESSRVTFGGVPFSVEAATNPRALTVGTGSPDCASSAVDPGVIDVGRRGGRLWLLGAADNDVGFPNALFAVTINYANGTTSHLDVHELHTGLTGFTEFSSWGQNGRPDLAVYDAPANDGSNFGLAFVYEYFVDLDPRAKVSNVTISAPGTINSAYIYGATLEKRQCGAQHCPAAD